VWLYQSAAKGFFPQEDIGQLSANIDTAEDMSYEGRLAVLRRIQATVMADPAVATVAAKVDHDTTALVIELKDQTERGPMAGVIRRLRADTAYLPGVQVLFSPVQNLRVGGRSAKSTYQYTLQAVGPADLGRWAERLAAEMGRSSVLVGVASDDQKNGMLARLGVDRDKAALLGVDMASLRNTLNAAYGSRQVSTVYAAEDSYPVIMEIADRQRRTEADILSLQVRGAGATLIPLGAFARVDRANGALSVSHQMQLPAVTLSFDMAPGRSLSEARAAIDAARTQIGMPDTVVGNFAGQAALFEQSQGSQLWLILIAVATIYVVLGMLYESWIHPLTILLGLPSAGLGALLAIRLCGLELSFIAMIGILLLIGIVKKNAIMMIDFAIEARRSEGLGAHDAIVRACELRFRPIMMTTLCSLMGALPLALGWGAGGELRQPLGVSIVGGLLFSQGVTLLVTPVLYLVFDRWAAPHPRALPAAPLPAS
jgi:HAE1 family hydrophobic/amphiphilic exporter-1